MFTEEYTFSLNNNFYFYFRAPPQSTPQPVKLLSGLTSKIDRILIPACEVPFSSCCNTDRA